MKNSRKLTNILLDYGIIAVLVLLFIGFSIGANNFASAKTIVTILKQVSINGIIAVGMAFVIIAGGIDISVGALVALCGVVFCKLYAAGVEGLPAILIVLVVGILLGAFNGFCVTILNIPPLIATLGTQTVVRGSAYLITGGIPVTGMSRDIMNFAQGSVGPIPYLAIMLVAVFIIGALVLNKTKVGRHIYAVGGNADSSRLSGINPARIRFLTYAIAGLCSSISAMMLISRTNSGQPAIGIGYEMDAITAVVLGGVSIAGGEGNLWLVTIGVLIMGVLKTGMTMMYLNEFVQQVVQGAVLILAVAFANFSQKMKSKNITVD